MKNILKKSSFMLLFVLSFAIQSISQTNPYVITVDSLENEQAIVTLERTDGLFYSQYLFLEPPYELNLTESTDNTTYTDDDPDIFWGNIDFPNEYGACMPRDVFYNIPNQSYYVYGGKKIIIIDGDTKEKTGEIKISDTEIIFGRDIINLNPEHHITGNQNQAQPFIYCATEDGKLVIINANTNQITKEINVTCSGNEIKASVIYSPLAEAAFWYICSGGNGSNRIGKIVGQNETESVDIDYGINDITCDPDGNFLYISSTSGIYRLKANDLSNPQNLIFDGTGCMAYGDDKLFAYRLGVKKMLCCDFNEGSYYTFDINYYNISKMVFNPHHIKLYYTGTINDATDNNSGIGIASKIDDLFVEVEAYNYKTAIGLIYNSDNHKTYCGSYNRIVSIYGDNNDICDDEILDGTFCYDLATDDSGQNIISLQNTSGNAMFLYQDCSTQETINLGGTVVGGCVIENDNGVNKSYFIVDKKNFNSYLIEVDNNSNQVLNEYEIPYDFQAITINCNKKNDNIYIGGMDSVEDEVLIRFNCELEAFNEIINFYNNEIMSIFSAPNGKLYVVITNNSDGYRYIYLWENSDYTSPIILPLNSTKMCVTDVKYYNGFVYVVSKCSSEIFIVNGVSNQLEDQNDFREIDPVPHSIALEGDDNGFFVGQIGVISMYNSDYSFEWEETIEGVDRIAKVISNPYSEFVYGLSPYYFIVLNTGGNRDYEKYEHNSDVIDMVYDSINNRLYIFSSANNENKGNLWVWDCHNNEEIGKLYFDNNYNFMPNDINNIAPASEIISFVPGQNKLYTSNQCFSNISVIDGYTDKLNLYAGWTWLSFPRMERSLNDPSLTIPVLKRIECYPVELQLKGGPPNSYDKYYDPIFNEWTGELDNVESTSGYKLNIDYQGGMNSEIDLYGAKLDPETEMILAPNVENWVGYFLVESQDPWDALGGQEWADENLQMIKTQFWTMIKECNQGDDCEWRTDGRVTPFKYGDMVILKTDSEIPITLQWTNASQPPSTLSIPQPEYFSYEEKADYIPLYMEFESTSDIQEIAVIADGEYKGAAVRVEGDTIVELNAYLEGTPAGAPLEFETWNGFKASNVKDNYLVFDHQLQTNVKRQIYAGENRQYYVISLREGEEFNIPENLSEAYCRPNPFTGETTITFRLNKSQNTKVEIFNLSGKSIKTLMEGEFPTGLYNLVWKGDNTEGKKVKDGIYFYKINCGDKEVISGKIVKIK